MKDRPGLHCRYPETLLLFFSTRRAIRPSMPAARPGFVRQPFPHASANTTPDNISDLVSNYGPEQCSPEDTGQVKTGQKKWRGRNPPSNPQ